MPHESTVNPYDYMGDNMNNMVNRISRGSNLDSNVATTLNNPTSEQPTRKSLTNLEDFYEQKTFNSPVTDRNRKLFYGSESLDNSNLEGINKRTQSATEQQLVKPETPSELTHYEDLDDDDDELDEGKSLENTTNSSKN